MEGEQIEEPCSCKNTEVPAVEERSRSQGIFKNFKVWSIVLFVYMAVFGYIGYIAFWPMAFNDPEETVEKYYAIIDKHSKGLDSSDREVFRTTITELIKESESEADDMQQLASQSFNIVLGGFLAFLSATVTTIFQGNRG